MILKSADASVFRNQSHQTFRIEKIIHLTITTTSFHCSHTIPEMKTQFIFIHHLHTSHNLAYIAINLAMVVDRILIIPKTLSGSQNRYLIKVKWRKKCKDFSVIQTIPLIMIKSHLRKFKTRHVSPPFV